MLHLDDWKGREHFYAHPLLSSFLLINNRFWLHGRDRFKSHPGLRRELMRQCGYFTHAKTLRDPRQA